ncbi:MAG: hypothetical protein ACT4PI_16740, partial [Actinomycetota bacterium]
GAGGGGGGGGGGSTPPTTTPPTTTVPTDPGTGEPGSDPLMLNISIHTDGYTQEDDPITADDPDGGRPIFDVHVAALTGLADDADGGDGVDPGDAKITFELTPSFVAATEMWGSTFIADMDARGHGIGVHADYGGQGYVDRATFTAELVSQREAIEAQGVDVVHVSGICSPSEWVEAAIDAGFTATTGMVEFCQSSYPGNYPLACGDAANECHGMAVTDWEHLLHPWRTSTSADWLTADPSGALLLVANGGASLSCLSEDAAGATCGGVGDSGDLDEFERLLREFIGHREAGRVNVLTFSWPVGRPPTAGFADELFAMVAGFDSSQVQWATMADIVAAAA